MIKLPTIKKIDDIIDVRILLLYEELSDILSPDLVDYIAYNQIVDLDLILFIKTSITRNIIDKKGYKYDND